MEPVDLSRMRVGYNVGDDAAGADQVAANLDPAWFAGDPPWLELFGLWLADGVAAEIAEPNAMVLATVNAAGRPSTRTVLCKGASAEGIEFFTGYDSNKGHDLDTNPYAAVTFPWIELERQVHFAGPVTRVSHAETQEYWAKRPRGSQLGSAASYQSRPIESRAALEAQAKQIAAQFDSQDRVPAPARWGGYRLRPELVEFWQGREDRLHNRVRLTLVGGAWEIVRLQP